MRRVARFHARTLPALLAGGLTLAFATEAAAQRGGDAETGRMLRQAAALEANGDLEGAERALRDVLAREPASAGALFALERVVSAREGPLSVLPAVRTFLQHDPAASEVRSLHLRVLAEADSLAALEREAEAWLAVRPVDVDAYREVARIYQGPLGPGPSLAVLRRGRSAAAADDALALEIGDALLALGHVDEALTEWIRAVGEDGAGAPAVTRRLADVEREQAAGVLAELAAADVFARRRAGALMSLELGFAEEATDRARAVADELGGRARTAFLERIGERARAQELPGLAAWAYDELGDDARTPVERRAFDQRRVEAALLADDSAAAADAQWRIARSYGPGEPDRRRATARAIELEAGLTDIEVLREQVAQFGREFAQAPEHDRLATLVASRLQATGDAPGAFALLEGVRGPQSAMERAYLLLASGDVDAAREALLDAAGSVEPSEATDLIQLAGLLGRLSPAAAELVGRTAVGARDGGADAFATLEAGLERVPPAEHAAVLAEGARVADRSGALDAAVRLRTRLLEAHAGQADAADALMALARHHAAREGGRERAIAILEELVASRPDGAVAPAARAELARLRGIP